MRQKIKHIIKALRKYGGNISLAAQELGLARSTLWRWKQRSSQHGRYLAIYRTKRKSTRPHHISYILTQQEKSDIIALRKARGWTAEKIKVHLKLKVAHRTIHRFLRRVGMVKVGGYHRRPRFQKTVHMHVKNVTTIGYLQMDVKVVTPELSGLPWTCFEYAVIDIYSRYKEAVILNQLDQDGAMAALLEIMPKLPFKPVFIQTDNGLEFQARFQKFCTDMGLKHHLIHKSSPNENAVIERSFPTDEEEFYFRIKDRPEHYDDLRQQLAVYLKYYNYERLHLGINLKTPAEVVAYVLSD